MTTFTRFRWTWITTLLVAAFLAPVSASSQTLPTAAQVAAQINVGWNIGNSLEVPGGETLWGNPAVNLALIDAVKAAGFNAVRIPCAWDSHQTNGTIDPAWLARVKEVVDYAIVENDMYVILNIHWDGGWLEEHPLYSYQDAVNAKQRSYWTQIANHFKAYDERLLFAGTNEVHADYGEPTPEHIEVQESYNQTFVDAVRATGGNNASRTLVVQTYNTNMWHGLNYFTAPTDSIAARQMLEVHYYDPYDFTLNQSGPCLAWGAQFTQYSDCSWAQESYVDGLFAQLKTRWVDTGVPVIIGEYGVATRPNLDLAARAYWLKYTNQAATRNGIKTFYWDNGVLPSATNGFALFNRSTGAVVDQAALTAVITGAGVGNPNQSYTLTTTVNGSGSVSRSPTGTTYPGGTNVVLTATPAAGYEFVGWTGDASGSANPITVRIIQNSTVTANFLQQGTGGNGRILREYWNNVTGATIASLTSNAAYPNSPTGSQELTILQGPTNVGDNYGARIRGYVHPPITGSYTFWFASDDAGDLLLSTDATPANARRIAYVAEWTDPLQWTKFTTQKSATITLTAGQKYYVEVLHKEATGGDHFAVSWQGPGMQQTIIGGNFISPFTTTGTSWALTVTKAGTGTGTVTSSTGGINCGTTCSATLASGTTVTLTAAAASGSTFGGWGGACTGTGSCIVTMTAARNVTATFNGPSGFALNVTKSGTGTGTVTSNTGGINCGSTCSATYTSGTVVTLTAAAASGSTFGGWSNGCTGTATTCTVTMSQARTVNAAFNGPSGFALTVTKSGTGTGTVTSNTGGINCGSTCSATYTSGTVVTLTRTLGSGSTFGGWSGACTGTGTTCVVTMSQARTVNAAFNGPAGFALTVTKSGTGAGTVTSSTGGINCGSTCSATYTSGTVVTLTAAVASGSTFGGWSNGCTGTATTCTVTMSQARTVTATFNGGSPTPCTNPITFTGNTNNFGTTGAVCYRTNATINGWGCYNMDGRTITVGGVTRTCGQTPLTRDADGYTYFSVTAGTYAWAGIYTW